MVLISRFDDAGGTFSRIELDEEKIKKEQFKTGKLEGSKRFCLLPIAVSEPYQNLICSTCLGCPSSEEQIPQVVKRAKNRNKEMSLLEHPRTLVRQAL
jgi:hypothetical protein